MARADSNRGWQSAVILLAGTVITVVVVACLYWAQIIFMPIALAIFLTFLLSPLVAFLQRHGIRRVPAVLGVMLLTLLLLSGLVYLVTTEVTALAARLPGYSGNIQAKVKVISDRLERLNHDLERVLGPTRAPSEDLPGDGVDATPTVVVKPDAPPWVSRVPEVLRPAAEVLGGGGLALVLTAFMLLKREDLRNRLIRLVGQRHVMMATRALDDAGQRISRFLIMQALISGIAGVAIGLGLLLIGVEYALLWGFLVFVLRYVPYLGVWFAALPPILLSFAMFEGWTQPLLVVTLIFVVEMICGNVLEPTLYGQSLGVSEVSFLVAAAFWALLWGPIGMVLSSPLTVCLVVLGKYHPRLKFLDVLLGDEPALTPDVRFYQRLLVRDQDEASDIVQAQLKEASAEQVFDELLVPALIHAKRDRDRDELREDDEEFILTATTEIGEELAERLEVPAPIPTGPISGIPAADLPERIRVLACPAHDAEDRLALQLLAASLDPTRWEVEILSPATLGSELVSLTGEKQPDLICISALPPGGVAHTRYLCKRLRSHFPGVKIIVARCGRGSGDEQTITRLQEAGADLVASSLAETRHQLESWRPVLSDAGSAPASPRPERSVGVKR